jgi:hypothetical protein
MVFLRWIAMASLALTAAAQAERPDLVGTVMNEKGEPIAGATIDIYTAKMREGVSIVCPSCYADCAKMTRTDASGAFRIPSLDPALFFKVLAEVEIDFKVVVDEQAVAARADVERDVAALIGRAGAIGHRNQQALEVQLLRVPAFAEAEKCSPAEDSKTSAVSCTSPATVAQTLKTCALRKATWTAIVVAPSVVAQTKRTASPTITDSSSAW